ncbi:MAG: CoB--CoM heterodisulfide reductase subunit C [Methanobrevibacter sp.]|nr:CoB--CoM heterodisulfide reductase subunit C [Methanobrevibacter sp.]MBO5966788.1 CoB--CoM heterodisulfide reductase subunit C [Methanobrevibacter sp.]MBO6105282.1 CoB--CoM heterodisulfide reductase subunit C [Methanobrevibacter sp.]MBO7444262.1 CoB--CoM heterodisulfide reductase subunit C [Methanobrevibacter sp.]MBO7735367.1 CoB--CoM heterodisulfide reductase subunit C [Methanobrevibacter sp.]
MSVLDTLKSLIGRANKDIEENLSKEAESVEEAADSIQTSSEEEIEIKSDSETISEEEAAEVPIEEVAEAEEEVEAEEAPVEEEAVEEAVEEVPEEEVSLDNDDKLSEDEAPAEEASEENEESDNMTLLKENDIYSMDDIDKEFTQKFVDAGIETVDHCFQCGTCGGGCPSGRRTPYRVRQIVRKCLLGLREEVVSDPALWMCTTCYTCQERCPRSVKIVDIIKMARNEAAKAGYMADAHKATGSFVIKTGHGVPINDKTKALRADIGLPELPPTVHAYPEALEEIQKICAACEFDKLIGFNMETGELE